MRVHALETGVAVIRERQLRRVERLAALRTALSRTPWTEIPVRAWLIEHPAGLILVDTGWTARVNEPGYLPRENLYMRRALRPRITPEEELGPRLRELGFAPDDVRWTVLTHMHLDHEGGLSHVKDSEIVVSETEYGLARGLAGRLRGYLPHRWPDGFAPRVVNPPEEGLELADGVVLLATPGHTAGHMSVLVEGEPRILIAGDAAYNEDLLYRGIPDSLATDPARRAADHGPHPQAAGRAAKRSFSRRTISMRRRG